MRAGATAGSCLLGMATLTVVLQRYKESTKSTSNGRYIWQAIRNHAKTATRITGQMALQGEQVPLGKQDVRRRLREEHEEYQQWLAERCRRLQRREQSLSDEEDVHRHLHDQHEEYQQ